MSVSLRGRKGAAFDKFYPRSVVEVTVVVFVRRPTRGDRIGARGVTRLLLGGTTTVECSAATGIDECITGMCTTPELPEIVCVVVQVVMFDNADFPSSPLPSSNSVPVSA